QIMSSYSPDEPPVADPAPPQIPDTGFKLDNVFVFPNPARAGRRPVFHAETSAGAVIEIKIFSVSGRPAHQKRLDAGSDTVEYSWNENTPSGVYYYTVTAAKDGRVLKKAGKFAVVR
ncbi:MAG: T9SS type A sorting domain-containing protein, partial [bacterium]